MKDYQTITLAPSTPRRIFVPAGALLGVCDPEGGQPFALDLEDGAAVEVVSSTGAGVSAGEVLRRRVAVTSDRRSGAELTIRACRGQWLEVGTMPSDVPSLAPLTPQTALRVRVPLAFPDQQFNDLPEPLAPVIAEYRINGATAIAYKVKAGQYIQILNVEGSQCADFLAFAGTGRMEELDGAATRTLNGTAMPGAGLHGKYFSQEMRPLIEVIQDTCGRHDSFLLACSELYYDDIGYPGHANCTTNFNLNLAKHAIAARPGWAALNFFFNTEVLSDGTIVSGESWARPGDYVLLRAQTDLLCTTSSCADDIDPVNGWNPTPIHVRLYDSDNRFPAGSGRRVSRERPLQMTQETAFTPSIRALTDDLADLGGFWLPKSYAQGGEHAEYWALREKAAIMDLSSLRKFEVYGPDAFALLQTAFSRDLSKLKKGQSAYGCFMNAHGGMVNDGIVFRLSEAAFRVVSNCETDGDWLRRVAGDRDFEVRVKSSSDLWHNLALQGPQSRAILGPILALDPEWGLETLEEMRPFRFAAGRIGEVPVLVSRTGYTGELGYELFGHPQGGTALWDSLLKEGGPQGLLPMGLAALDRARIEAGLLSSGREFDPGVSPFQAGIGWTVSLKKPDFIGKSASERLQAAPPCVAVGLTLDGNEVAPIGEHLYASGDTFPAGRITSATFSPLLNRSIALAQVFPEYGALGTELEVGFVDGQSRRTPAIVGPLAAYDPQKLRVKS